MTVLSLVLIVTILAFLLIVVIAGLSRHKKSATRTLDLIGATGFIESRLDPEGAVIINGELWRARAERGSVLKARNRVRVVGVKLHLLLVEPISGEQ